MRKYGIGLLGALALAALSASQASANLLANPSFEDPITSDGPPFVGSWEGFQGPGALASNGNASPRSGLQELNLVIDNTNNTFTGAFQDVPGLTAGTPVIFSGWHKKGSNPADVGVEIRIEWRNSGSNSEITRTPNLTDAPGNDYIPFTLPSIVPAGADTARVVYAIQTFGGEPGPTNTGLVYVDDVSLVIPEPMSIALCGLGGLALLFVRRR